MATLTDRSASILAAGLQGQPVQIGPLGGLPGFAGSARCTFDDGSSVDVQRWGRDEWTGGVDGGPDSQAAAFLRSLGLEYPFEEDDPDLEVLAAAFQRDFHAAPQGCYYRGADPSRPGENAWVSNAPKNLRWFSRRWNPTDPAVAALARRAKATGGIEQKIPVGEGYVPLEWIGELADLPEEQAAIYA